MSDKTTELITPRPAYTPEMRDLLTRLRGELNHLNTLNVIVHRYQGDFSIDKADAERRTEGATWLYLQHLNNNVIPLFVELGKELDKTALTDFALYTTLRRKPNDEDFELMAKRWYQDAYQTGVMW